MLSSKYEAQGDDNQTKDPPALTSMSDETLQVQTTPEPNEPHISLSEGDGDAHTRPSGRSVRIDINHIERIGCLSPRHPVTRIAEEFRVLKGRILTKITELDSDKGAKARVIMVTSAQPREGKTFTTINLALSIAAERDRHVLLIDGDFAHPALFRTLALKRTQGFLDVLRDPELDLRDVIRRTNIDHLSLIDSGRSSALAAEFLSSEKMQSLVREIAERYQDRIIIFDSPPMLATSEPSILSHHVGQVLFIVEAGRTSQRSVRTALDLIHDKEKILLILNKQKSILGAQTFGSYYYYYKKRGDKVRKKDLKPRRRLFSRD